MKKTAFISFLFFLSLLSYCQDFDLIFKKLPNVGAYAKYKYKNTKEDGKIIEGELTVSVTKKEIIEGVEYVLVEIYPFTFKALTMKTGTLGIMLKVDANEQENKNFILRAKKVMFAQEGKEPYEVEESVLQMLRDDSKNFKLEKVEKERERKIVEFKNKIISEVVVYDSDLTFYEEDGDKQNLTGTKEISADIPFCLVREEYIIKKIGKDGKIKKTIKSVTELTEFSDKDAKSAFPDRKMKKKGFWGIIFS